MGSFRSKVSATIPDWVKPFGRFLERCAIRVNRAVLPPKLPKNPDGKIYINLGCGYATHPAFINVDALAAWHIHYIRPIDDLRPLPDNYADLVYASHCLEHFSHRAVDRVLTEWRRVLKPGGVLRLGVPDFEKLITIYEHSGKDIEVIQGFLMGGQTYPLNSHYTSFTRESLTNRLRAVGFGEVRVWEKKDELTSIDDCCHLTVEVNQKTFPISLNLEAVK